MDKAYFFIRQLWGFIVIHRVKFLISLSALLIITNACSQINRYLGQNDDWWGEELLEEQIEKKTGVEIDLTPTSIEVFSRDF